MATPAHSGDMSQDSTRSDGHQMPVPADRAVPPLEPAVIARRAAPPSERGRVDARIDPAARASKRMYQGLSASSIGLELGLSVVLALLFGMWLDRKLGTQPWMMLLFLVLGLVAGFRGVMRAVARVDRETP